MLYPNKLYAVYSIKEMKAFEMKSTEKSSKLLCCIGSFRQNFPRVNRSLWLLQSGINYERIFCNTSLEMYRFCITRPNNKRVLNEKVKSNISNKFKLSFYIK